MSYNITKKPVLGAFLTLLFGPFGFLYYSVKKMAIGFLVVALPFYLLYRIPGSTAEIVRWSAQTLMATYVYFDLSGNLDFLDELLAQILKIITIPITVLNFLSGIVSGIWLIIGGNWKLVVVSIIITFVAPYAYMIVTLIQMPLLALMQYCQVRGKKILGLLAAFLNIFIGHSAILFYVFIIFSKVLELHLKTTIHIIPLFLLGFVVSTGPFGFMASKEDSDSIGTFLGVLISQFSFIIFALMFFLGHMYLAIPLVLLFVFTVEVFQINVGAQLWDEEDENQNHYTYDLSCSTYDLDSLVSEGKDFYRIGDYKQAFSRFNDVLLQDESRGEVYYYRALTRKKLNIKDGMVDDLKNAATLGHSRSIEVLEKNNISY